MVLITPAQLKATNLIFNEHFELKWENGLLNSKVARYEELYKDELVIDSIYEANIANLYIEISDCSETIQNQSNSIQKLHNKVKCWRSISLVAFVILICML